MKKKKKTNQESRKKAERKIRAGNIAMRNAVLCQGK